MRSIKDDTQKTIFSLCNSNIEVIALGETVQLKASLIIMMRMRPRFSTVKDPDFNFFLCISDMNP